MKKFDKTNLDRGESIEEFCHDVTNGNSKLLVIRGKYGFRKLLFPKLPIPGDNGIQFDPIETKKEKK